MEKPRIISDLDEFIVKKASEGGKDFLHSLPVEEQARLVKIAEEGLERGEFPPDGILIRFETVGDEEIVIVLGKKEGRESGYAFLSEIGPA